MTIRKKRKKKIIILILSAVLLVALALFTIFSLSFKTTAAAGVSICGVDVGGMTRDEARMTITERASDMEEPGQLTVVYKNKKAVLELEKINPVVDIEGTLDKAFSIGKNGNIATRITELISSAIMGRDEQFHLSLNRKELQGCLEPIMAAIPDLAEPVEYEITDSEIVISPGTSGNLPDYERLEGEISARLFGRKTGRISLEIVSSSYDSITAEDIYREFYSEVKDAEYIKDANGSVTVIPHSDGVDFDVKKAQKIIDKSGNDGCSIPIEFVPAKITFEELSQKLYSDELSSYYSGYAVGNTGRNTNLELACSKLDGTELMPGELFSYVGVVGQGTYEEGYVDAAVYANGEVATGVAGGICQGSSTLYSAVLFADLEVVQRVNHSMPVGYVPHGMDATIATPYIDFQFKNSTGYPLKIVAQCSGGQLTVRLFGTDENPEKEVEITNKLISTTPFKTEVKEIEGMAEGEEIIKQNGTDGCVIETYKTIKINGEEQSTELVSTSRYDPISQIVEKAPEKEETEEEKEPESEEASPQAEQTLEEAPPEEPTEEIPTVVITE